MNTSTNHPSPNTHVWRPAKAVLGRLDLDTAQQSLELWRSALSDRAGRLTAELTDPLIARACEIAEARMPPGRAVQSFDEVLVQQYAAGLMLDLAKRALARASASKSGSVGFASELFAETISYYASRDLPSFVGAPGRIQKISDSIALKEELQNIARGVARAVALVHADKCSSEFTDAGRLTATTLSTPDGWRTYVVEVISILSGESTGQQIIS